MARPPSPFTSVLAAAGPAGINGYSVREELSSGSYFRTHLAIRIADNAASSLKIVKGFDALSASVKAAALAEVSRWRALAHPNVVSCSEAFQHLDALLLACPLAPLGSAPFSPPVLPLPAEAAALAGFQLASGLAAVHAAGLVHRNVRPASLVLFRDGGDFPSAPADAAALIEGGRVALGDPSGALAAALCPSEGVALAYAAPEVLNDEDASPAADVWGLGATLLELATGHVVGEAPPARRLLKRGDAAKWTLAGSLRGAYAEGDGARAAAQLAAWEALPAPLRALITACLAPAARARPTAAAAAAHEAFSTPRIAAEAREMAHQRATCVYEATLALRAQRPLASEQMLALLEAAATSPGLVEDADVSAACAR